MVTIRKDWLLRSPSRGGDVRGRAVDQSGDPVAGALVRLGPYSTITDDAGGYAFTRVPDGTLDLSLDRDKLPAAYGLAESPRPLNVTRRSRTIQDLEAIPLNAIRGRVYVDLNGDGDFDEGEGVPNVVIASEGVVTATTATGAYGFYNLPPGPYTIQLDVPRLAKGMAVVSPSQLDVELMPDRPLLGVDFILERRDMPILMRALGR